MTQKQIIEVAARLNSQEDVQRLAATLDVQSHRVSASLNDHRDRLSDAALEILLAWERTVPSDTEARQLLTKALRDCKQLRILSEVFGED